MFIDRVRATNFRIFGDAADDTPAELDLTLRKGLNCLIGENDSGKSSIIDAIRLCLGTTTSEFRWLSADDFHCGASRATSLRVQCRFAELSDNELASFLEFVTTEDGKQVLWVSFEATRSDSGRISTTLRSGIAGDGPHLDGLARDQLRVTYLRPLRDAESELRSGRNSRLSQILASHEKIAEQRESDFDQKEDTATTLVGIVRRAEHHLGLNQAVKDVRDELNDSYLTHLQLESASVQGEITVSGDGTLERILEKLELKYGLDVGRAEWTRRGLGYNNALFMAAEMLLLGKHESSAMLIEEPEAHLHPQLLQRVVELLQSNSASAQVIVSTHSPNFACSIPLACLTIVMEGKTFWLGQGQTRLDASDYAFLERFLDVTKSNMFFARRVVIVEGDAEAILLPALAKAVGVDFGKLGVAVVNVGHTGLFRYSRVFQRLTTPEMPVMVICLRDRDLAPDGATDEMKGKLRRVGELDSSALNQHLAALTAGDDNTVRTYVSDQWTFEYDLAASSWPFAEIVHRAISKAKACNKAWPSIEKLAEREKKANQELAEWRRSSASPPDEKACLEIYKPLRLNLASKAIAAQFAAADPALNNLSPHDLPSYLRSAFSRLCGDMGD